MYKIIHIHNDIKFIDETVIFENPLFENEVVILGEKGDYKGKYQQTATYLPPSRSKINLLIRHCNNADMVVLHNLCFIKSYIANRLATNVKIAWRFFGHELYRYDIVAQQSDLTKAMMNPIKFSLSGWIKRLKSHFPALRGLRNLIKLRTLYEYEFRKAMNRVNFFLSHFEEEYRHLEESWPNLPQFINLPTFDLSSLNNNCSDICLYGKENIIIIGNSRNALNNHFDILEKLILSKNFDKYKIFIPFSYDGEKNYVINLKEKVVNYKNIVLSDVFLPFNDYQKIFKQTSAIVVNTYRQKALGNIFLALKNGVKVYLNTKNTTYAILASKGLYVFPVDQLYNDLETGNTRLSLEAIKHNADIMRKLADENSIVLFQRQIYQVLNSTFPEP
jgi:dTDP-N-acetylfucosamine:lipid II N-acetylfucosaminyltransferase